MPTSKDITIRFAMTKSERDRPELSDFNEDEIFDIRLCSELNIDWQPDQMDEKYQNAKIISMEFLYDGITLIEDQDDYGYRFEEDKLTGYPAPIIRFKLDRKVNTEQFLHSIWESSFLITPESMKDSDDCFIAEDLNGNSSVISGDELEEWGEYIRDSSVFSGKRILFTEGMPSCGFQIPATDFALHPGRIGKIVCLNTSTNLPTFVAYKTRFFLNRDVDSNLLGSSYSDLFQEFLGGNDYGSFVATIAQTKDGDYRKTYFIVFGENICIISDHVHTTISSIKIPNARIHVNMSKDTFSEAGELQLDLGGKNVTLVRNMLDEIERNYIIRDKGNTTQELEISSSDITEFIRPFAELDEGIYAYNWSEYDDLCDLFYILGVRPWQINHLCQFLDV